MSTELIIIIYLYISAMITSYMRIDEDVTLASKLAITALSPIIYPMYLIVVSVYLLCKTLVEISNIKFWCQFYFTSKFNNITDVQLRRVLFWWEDRFKKGSLLSRWHYVGIKAIAKRNKLKLPSAQ